MTKAPEEITRQAKAKDPDDFNEKFSGNLFYMAFMEIDKDSLNIGGVTELRIPSGRTTDVIGGDGHYQLG